MARGKALDYKEFIALAQANYSKGGADYVECWDERTFENYTKECGPITKTKAMKMFREDADIQAERSAMMSPDYIWW